MLKKIITVIITIVSLMAVNKTMAQKGVGTNPDASSILDLRNAGNKGFLAPQVKLSATATSPAPVSAGTNITYGIMVYNTDPTVLNGTGYYTWDSTGVGSGKWTHMATTNAWLTAGNAGTDTTQNFLGTTDNKALMFRINNQKAGMVSANNTILGYQAFLNGGAPGAGFENTAVGVNALAAGGNYYENTAIGFNALSKARTSANTAVGAQALANFTGSTGGWNTAVGYLALTAATTGADNTALGSSALNFTTTGNNNLASGLNALIYNTTGSYNTALGNNALNASNYTGNNNTALGNYAGNATNTGSFNIFIGAPYANYINGSSATASYEMNIGNTLFGTSIDSTVGVGRIGINTNAPQAAFHVKGTARIDTLPSGAATDSIVTVDNTVTTGGNLRRRTVNDVLGGTAWLLKGNAGTDTTQNFLGTTDNKSLMLRVNNTNAGWLSSANTSVGYQSLSLATTGQQNTAIGVGALNSLTYSSANVAVGDMALNKNIAAANVAVGVSALQANTTGNYSSALGFGALQANTTGSINTAVGSGALQANTTGNNNIAVGGDVLTRNITGSNNTVIGNSALANNINGSNNVVLGYYAGVNTTQGNSNILIGGTGIIANRINASSPIASNEMNIGNTLFGTSIDSTVGVGRIGINTNVPQAALHVKGTVRIDTLSSGAATDSLVTVDNVNATGGNLHRRAISDVVGNIGWLLKGNSGTDTTQNFVGTTDNKSLMFRINNTNAGWLSNTNTSLGYQSLILGSTGQDNTAIGVGALSSNTFSWSNTALGYMALNKNVGSANVALGASTLQANTSGNWNNANGYLALVSNTSGNHNNAMGSAALWGNTTGSYNDAFGGNALYNNTTGLGNVAMGHTALNNNNTGSYNLAIGYAAGANTASGNNNILIGGTGTVANQVKASSGSASYEMNIGNTLFGTSIDSTVGAGKIGVNTVAPRTTLHANGSLLAGSDSTNTKYLYWNLATGSLVAGATDTAWGNYSAAIGQSNKALASSAFAQGFKNIASGNQSVAMGNTDTASAGAAFAMGNNNNASGAASAAIGSYNQASAQNSMAFGNSNNVSALYGVALGQINTVTGTAGIAAGYLNTAALNAVALGVQNNAAGTSSVVIGSQNINNGTQGAAAIGLNHNITSASIAGVAIGDKDTVSGSYATAIGLNNKVAANNAIVVGAASNIQTGSDNAIAIGTSNSASASATNSISIGNYINNQNTGAAILADASSSSFFVNSTANNQFTGMFNGGYRFLVSRTVTSNGLFMTNSGWVGIGNATPAYTLDVTGDINASGSVRAAGVVLSSDMRYKKNIATIQSPLSIISQLRGTQYNFRTDEFPAKHFSSEKQYGVIAQEMEKVLPELVATDKDGYKSVNYIGLIPVMIEGMKSQQIQINSLQQEDKKKQATINNLQDELDSLKKQVEEIKAALKR